jgi:hypothetical protein
MSVFSENREFGAVGMPQFGFAFAALKGRGCNKPSAPFDNQIIAIVTLESKIHVP